MDSTSTIILTALIIALLALSAFFSGTETAYTSVSKTRLKNMANDGNKKAQRVLSNCDNFDRLLTTVLVGNNIVFHIDGVIRGGDGGHIGHHPHDHRPSHNR